MTITKKPDNSVRVVVRIRPLVRRETLRGDRSCTNVTPGHPQITIGDKSTFTFDNVFDTNSQQSQIYDSCVRDLVAGTFEGFNATVFAYGQTGSGKTHTMGTGMNLSGTTPEEELGIVPRAVKQVFEEIEARKRSAEEKGLLPPTFEVSVTFIELYNERIHDLINDNKDQTALKIQEDPQTGEIFIKNVTHAHVKSPQEMIDILEAGAINRTVGATNMNEQSSRSHAIFSIHIKQQQVCTDGDEGEPNLNNTTTNFKLLTAKFHFVDLAGSERLNKTGATGMRATEGININMGLLVLGNVIKALADNEKAPYRESKLTRLLQDSLGGNSRTMMIACASPSETDFLETFSTLSYANRAKNIKNKVVANQDSTSRLVNELRRKIAELEGEILELKSGKKTLTQDGTVVDNDVALENSELLAQVNILTTKIKAMSEALEVAQQRNIQIQQENFSKMSKLFNMKKKPEGEGASEEGGEDTGEEEVDPLASIANNYIEEIEKLRGELSESQATIGDLRKQVTRLKEALTNNAHYVPNASSGDAGAVLGTPQAANVSGLIEQLRHDIKVKQEKIEELGHSGMIESTTDSTGADDEDSMEDEEEDEEDEGDILVNEEKQQMFDEIRKLKEDILMKEQVVTLLERSELRLLSIKSGYEKKLAALSDQIRHTQDERKGVIDKINANSSKAPAKEVEQKIKEVKDKYEVKLADLTREFSRLKALERNHDRMVSKQQKQEFDLAKHREEIAALKKNRVDLMKKYREDFNSVKQREKESLRKLTALNNDLAKKTRHIQQLQLKDQQREDFLKRKNADTEKKIQLALMQAKIKAMKPATPKTPKTIGNKKVPFSPGRTRANWEGIEKNVFKKASKRQMYEELGEKLEVKIQDRQQISQRISYLENTFLKLTGPDSRKAVQDEIEVYKQKTDFLDREISELQQEITCGDDDIFEAPIGDASQIIENVKNLEESKVILKRLFDMAVDQVSAAMKAEKAAKALAGELEYLKTNCVEADDIVQSFMEHIEDEGKKDGTSPFEKPLVPKSEKVRQKTGTSKDFLYGKSDPETEDSLHSNCQSEASLKLTSPDHLNSTVIVSKPCSNNKKDGSCTNRNTSRCDDVPKFVAKRSCRKTLVFANAANNAPAKKRCERTLTANYPLISDLAPSNGSHKAADQTFNLPSSDSHRDVLKEVNGPNIAEVKIRLDDDEKEDASSISDPATNQKTQAFRRYEANNIVRVVGALSTHRNAVYCIACSDQYVISGSRDRTAMVFDAETKQKLFTLGGHASSVKHVKLVADQNLIITSSVFAMRLWDVRTGLCHRLLQSSGNVSDNYAETGRRSGYVPMGENTITAVGIDPTGTYMFSNYIGGLRCWDLRAEKSYGKIVLNDDYPINSIAVQYAEDASGRIQIVCGHKTPETANNQGLISVLNVYGNNPSPDSIKHIEVPEPITQIVADGKVLFCATASGNVSRYSLIDYRREHVVQRSQKSPALSTAVIRSPSDNSSLLAVGYEDGITKFFDYTGAQMLVQKGMMNTDCHPILSIATNTKQTFFATGNDVAYADITYDPTTF